jgi:hypothetical protein
MPCRPTWIGALRRGARELPKVGGRRPLIIGSGTDRQGDIGQVVYGLVVGADLVAQDRRRCRGDDRTTSGATLQGIVWRDLAADVV